MRLEEFVAVPDKHVFEERDVDVAASPVLRSPVACAVLGLVIEKPSHGYEIAQRFEGRFGQLLSASKSAIYATLAILMEAELIEKMPGRSTTSVRRGAKAGASYRATARGARASRGWLAERVRDDPLRVEMVGLMTLAGVHSVEAALDFIVLYEQDCVREARDLERPSRGASSAADGISGVIQHLVIEERRRVIDAQLAWITYARAELRALRNGSSRGDVSR